VYVVRDNIAHQVVVKTGSNQDGMVEIVEGLNANDTVVVDGAGFLTDKTKVTVESSAESDTIETGPGNSP
jgi:multidrug efflux pump subunit AcrA (membrane-fusion protein)